MSRWVWERTLDADPGCCGGLYEAARTESGCCSYHTVQLVNTTEEMIMGELDIFR